MSYMNKYRHKAGPLTYFHSAAPSKHTSERSRDCVQLRNLSQSLITKVINKGKQVWGYFSCTRWYVHAADGFQSQRSGWNVKKRGEMMKSDAL
jgi:hypothetical protein